MDRNEAIELLNKALGCVQTDPRNCGECKKCENYATKEDGVEALGIAIKALEGKDTNVPTNSALDHIHNVVAEREYQRGYKQAKEEYDHKLTEIKSRIKDHYYLKGYEQGKKNAAPKWIPFTAETAPKEDGLYFVKIKAKSGNERVKTDGYSTAYGEWFIHDNDKVKKWMPIPKDEGE